MDIYTFIAKLIDPASLIIATCVMLLWHSKWMIPVAGLVTAIAIEILLAAVQTLPRDMSDTLFPGFLASSIHAALFFHIRSAIRKRRSKKTKIASAGSENV